ncbi:MAG: c-type cytochrome [Pseudomonadota bacterium]|nr:MAG: c-type cytochrome [Pseudomonadota bacterium]
MKRLFFAALALALSGPIAAQSGEGDPEHGREIAYTCFGCHGVPFQQNAYPTYPVPKIGGQTYGYLVSALKAYRSGERKHATMQAQASTLSDQDIRDIAAYFVSLDDGGES